MRRTVAAQSMLGLQQQLCVGQVSSSKIYARTAAAAKLGNSFARTAAYNFFIRLF